MKSHWPDWYNPVESYNRIERMEKEAVKLLEQTTDAKLFKKGQRILNSMADTKKQIHDMMVKYG